MVAFVIMYYILKATLLTVIIALNYCTRNTSLGLKIEQSLKRGFIFSSLHGLVIETVFELTISVYINFRHLAFDLPTGLLSFSITCFVLVSFITVVYSYVLILKNGKDEVKDDEQFMERHG